MKQYEIYIKIQYIKEKAKKPLTIMYNAYYTCCIN